MPTAADRVLPPGTSAVMSTASVGAAPVPASREASYSPADRWSTATWKLKRVRAATVTPVGEDSDSRGVSLANANGCPASVRVTSSANDTVRCVLSPTLLTTRLPVRPDGTSARS